jgi:hypothetical protein
MNETSGKIHVNGGHVDGDPFTGAEEAVLLPGIAEEALIRQRWSERRWNATPGTLILNGTEIKVSKPRTRFTVHADDGTELLRIEVTEDGMLDVSGPEDRWTEGAARFAAEMRRLLADD